LVSGRGARWLTRNEIDHLFKLSPNIVYNRLRVGSHGFSPEVVWVNTLYQREARLSTQMKHTHLINMTGDNYNKKSLFSFSITGRHVFLPSQKGRKTGRRTIRGKRLCKKHKRPDFGNNLPRKKAKQAVSAGSPCSPQNQKLGIHDLEIPPLLDHLAQTEPPTAHEWNGWRIMRVTGGWNNLLYRATNDACDLALQDAGLSIAPSLILLERERYRLPVVVQTWFAGEVRDAPPANDAEWMRLLEHYAALARLKRANVPLTLPDAVVTAKSAEEAKARVRQQLALLPDETRYESITALIQNMETLQHSTAKFYPRTTQITRIEKDSRRFARFADNRQCSVLPRVHHRAKNRRSENQQHGMNIPGDEEQERERRDPHRVHSERLRHNCPRRIRQQTDDHWLHRLQRALHLWVIFELQKANTQNQHHNKRSNNPFKPSRIVQ
jgi:hypothetical protein